MNAKVVWKGDMSFVGENEEGFLIPLDSKKVVGGHDAGFRPLQLLAIGLVGCTGMDVISILRKKRQEVTDFEVTAAIERADQHPKVFTKIVLEYIVSGKNIDPEAVERAVVLSETKYCPAQAMLSKAAEITHKITINQID
jgi:putative redox protein